MQLHTHILMGLLLLLPTASVSSAEKVTYEADIKPILREHCFACHNQDDATASLALDSFDGLAAGGAGGEVVSAGDPDGSRLWKLITHQEEPKMPPGDKMPKANLDAIKAWIEGGLLRDAGSKPIKSKKPAIAKIDASKLGRPVGEPAMPEQLFHEPVLWAPTTGPVEALATSPWAPVAAIGWQRQVSFYHTDSHELLGIVPYVDGVPKVIRFSRDGSLVLVAGGRHSAAGSAALFDVRTGVRLATIGDELDIVLAADISPDLSLVAIGGPKKRVRVFRVADGQLAYQITKHTEWITSLAFSPNGKLLATTDRNGGALIWQATAGHERADLRGHKGAITSVDWRADSAMLATASEDGTVRLWDSAGKPIKSVTTNKGGVLSVRFSQDGQFVTVGRDRHVRTWKPDGGAIADLGQLPGMTLAAEFTHDSKRVIATDYTGEVHAFDNATKQSIAQLRPNPQYLTNRIASASTDLEKAQQLVQSSEKQAATVLTQLEAGKAVVAAHDAKLAETESALAESRKQYDNAARLLEQRKQQLAAKRSTAIDAKAALTAAKKQLDGALANLPESPESTETPEDPTATQAAADKVAKLKSNVEAAQAALNTANTEAKQTEQQLQAASSKSDKSRQSMEAAENLLAQVTDQTAGLPDVAKITEQYDKAKAELVGKQNQLKQIEQLKTALETQQRRFVQAQTEFAQQLETQQAGQQELAKQTGRLEAKHQQTSKELAAHTVRLDEVAQQLKRLQAKLKDLRATKSQLNERESLAAKRLDEVQTSLMRSQQQIDRLQQQQRDFAAAAKLREKYSAGR